MSDTSQADLQRAAAWVDVALAALPGEAQRCRDGETELLESLVRKAVESSSGRAEPELVRRLLEEALLG